MFFFSNINGASFEQSLQLPNLTFYRVASVWCFGQTTYWIGLQSCVIVEQH